MNIILFISDTFRYDNLSCYGPTQVRTPRLDEFSKSAYIFNNAYLSSFPTVPNRLDIMSGRFSFIEYEWSPLPRNTVTLQQILNSSGIVTQMIADTPHVLAAGFNYDRGFNGFEWIRGQEHDTWKTAPKKLNLPKNVKKFRRPELSLPRILRNTAAWKTEEDRFIARTVNFACQWLEDNRDQEQFYLYIDAFDPHEPWNAPKKYVDLYPTDYEGEDLFYPENEFWRDILTEKELNHTKSLYMAEVTMVDHWFGVLLDKITQLGLDENTAIIFTSDHGYLFGEHELTGKARIFNLDGVHSGFEAIPLYDQVRRIPLLIHLPGQKTGKIIKSLVQSPDLMPTILEMANIVSTKMIRGQAHIQALQCGVFYEKEWRFEPEKLHGKSLMPLMRGETNAIRDIAVCSNTIIHHTSIMAKSAIVTDDGWCLHYSGCYQDEKIAAIMNVSRLVVPEASRISMTPSLYYMPEDPQELNNLIDRKIGTAEEIHNRYVKWLEEVGTSEEHLAGRRHLWPSNK